MKLFAGALGILSRIGLVVASVADRVGQPLTTCMIAVLADGVVVILERHATLQTGENLSNTVTDISPTYSHRTENVTQ